MDTVSIVFLAALLTLWRTVLWRPRKLLGLRREPPLLIGHRGVRGLRPENTVAAFELAFASGLDGIETDVQRTADGRLVLVHDFELAGQRVDTLRWSDLVALQAEVAELEQLFEVARDYPGTLLNLELKADGLRSGGLERSCVRAIRRSGLSERILVSSFNPVSLLKVRLLAPELRTGLLYSKEVPRWLRSGGLAGWLHADALHPHESLVDAALMARVGARGLMVNTWTVNDPMRITSLHALKVTAIMGDDPATLLRAARRSPREE